VRSCTLGDQQVFENATTYTCLMFLDKAGTPRGAHRKGNRPARLAHRGHGDGGRAPRCEHHEADWILSVGQDAALFEKLRQMPVKLGDCSGKDLPGIGYKQ